MIKSGTGDDELELPRNKKTCPQTLEATYQIHEVYYQDDGSIDCWNEVPVEPLGTTEPDLRNDIHAFLSAFRRPVLEEHFINGKARLLAEHMGSNSKDLQADYAAKTSRAASYLSQILGSHLLLKTEPGLRQAYERVDRALAELHASIEDNSRHLTEL